MDRDDLIDAADGSPLRQRIIGLLPVILVLAVVVSLGALLFMASDADNARERALERQEHSYQVITLAYRVDGSIAKSEKTLARYVISMVPDTGRLFQSQWRLAGAELDALSRATHDDPVQSKLVADLRSAVSARGKALSEIGLRTTYDQKMAALSQFNTSGNDDSVKQIKTLLDEIIALENARLHERSLVVDETGNRTARIDDTYKLVGLVLLVGALFGIWAANAASRDRKQTRMLAEAEYARAEGLGQAVADRTAELEQANARLKQEAADRAVIEDNLRQMQKMEAVGQLTGGIAHDFNNMLAVVVGGLELAKRKLEGDPAAARKHLDNAMEGAGRASALTRRLLAFARSEPLLPVEIEPGELLSGMIELIDRTIGDQVRVETDVQADGWTIFADRHQLENALLNLAVNARDAMEGKGTLTLSVRRTVLGQGEIGECEAGNYVLLSVNDTGAGMTPEVLERVFEPFFTTKPRGKGTGLGLSQIFGFVRQTGGEIDIRSAPGEGTEVRMYLPRHSGASASADPGVEESSAIAGSGTGPLQVLVVEDDPRVLAQTVAALEELGHSAVACDHPAKAPGLLDQAEYPFDLIVSDLLMPDQTGPEMVKALPDRYAALPVLFVTGYAGEIDSDDLNAMGAVLRKPFTIAGLERALQAAISESPRSAKAEAAE